MRIDTLRAVKEVSAIEAKAIEDLALNLDENFSRAIELMLHTKGHYMVSSMGRLGHIGAKTATILTSTGTPSFLTYLGEALHRDLEMLTPDDVLIIISNSGEIEETLKIVPTTRKRKIPLVTVHERKNSTLVKQGDVFLSMFVKEEACPLQLAPMPSATAILVVGDALAAALMKTRNFRPDDFALFYLGGSLGRKFLARVSDLMVSKNLPIVHPDTELNNLVDVVTSEKPGLCLVVENKKLVGIITNRGLRHALEANDRPRFDFRAKEIMSINPKVVDADAVTSETEKITLKYKTKEIVVPKEDKVVGIIQSYAVRDV